MKKINRIIFKFFLISVVIIVFIFFITGMSFIETKEVFFRLKDFLSENSVFILIGFLVWFFYSTGFIQSLVFKNIEIDLVWDLYSIFWIIVVPLVISIQEIKDKSFLDNIDFLKPLLSDMILRHYVHYFVVFFCFFFVLIFLYVLSQRQKILNVGILINFVSSFSLACFFSFFTIIFRMVRLDKLDDSFGVFFIIIILYLAIDLGGIFKKEKIKDDDL
ncbi:MAG: hypothetical protein KBD12_02020 [Candidatus Pacebacteria bacterium]|nr:hypothetical protein [Candidatus Paceibacterota bacterium]